MRGLSRLVDAVWPFGALKVGRCAGIRLFPRCQFVDDYVVRT